MSGVTVSPLGSPGDACVKGTVCRAGGSARPLTPSDRRPLRPCAGFS